MITIKISPETPIYEAAETIKVAVDECGSVQCYWRGERLQFEWMETELEIASMLKKVAARRPL